jgi:hypothetical protein
MPAGARRRLGQGSASDRHPRPTRPGASRESHTAQREVWLVAWNRVEGHLGAVLG